MPSKALEMTEDQRWLCEVSSTLFTLIKPWIKDIKSDNRVSMMAVSSLRTAWDPSCWFCGALIKIFVSNISLWLTRASAIVYHLMDLSSDGVTPPRFPRVCLSVTPFLGFHPIKSWLKRWQTWHAIYNPNESSLSLDSQTLWRPPAPRTASKLSRALPRALRSMKVLKITEKGTENYLNRRETWLNQRMCSEWNTSALHTTHFIAYTA